jgi:proteic killer suppression protein
MNIEFRSKHLLELYKTGKSSKYRIDDNIRNKFFMRIQSLEAAVNISDLRKTPSLNFEKLEGYTNRFSVRLQKKWRLEFEIQWENMDKTCGTIHIVELSNHYR